MPRINKAVLTAVRARRDANDRRDADAWRADQARLSRSGKATVQVVLKQWTTAAGKTARVLLNMGHRRSRLSLEVGERVMDPRKAALHLTRRHESEFYPSGGYVAIRKPAIDRTLYPLAAAFVDLWWNDRRRAGELAVRAVEMVQGKRIAEQWANKHVQADLERAGRLDIWEAAKKKSGRPSCR